MSNLTHDQINVLKQVVPYINPADPMYCKLRTEFPEAFSFNIDDYVKEIGAICYGYNVNYNDRYVFIQLPNANSDWTFEAFRVAEKFCKNIPDIHSVSMYPVHGNNASRAINEAINRNIISEYSNYLVLSYTIH